MTTIDPELLKELAREEQNLAEREKEVERRQQICERRRNRVGAFKYLVEVLRANPVEPNDVEL